MLMKCSKCGYENQLNAIFCRGCGEKLNPAEVSPEALAQEAEKKKKASRKINWKPILGLVLLALVVVSVFGAGKYKIILTLGILFIPSFARIVRGEFAKEEATQEKIMQKAIGE